MTAVIHHGPPGSYKTFSLLQEVVIPALVSGRVVVTNIRGLDDIDHIESVLNAHRRPGSAHLSIPDTAQIITVPFDLAGFELMAKFFHWAPFGAIIVMDEGQKVYSTRLRSLSEFDYPGGPQQAQVDGRPDRVEDAFDRHRHFNWDIYISTPFIDKIHKEVRQTCEYAYYHRDMSGFLPWWKHKFKVIKHNPLNNGLSQSHVIDGIKVKKADAKLFDCYSSTATGVAKSSSESKSIFQNKKLIFFCCVILAALVSFGLSVNKIADREANRGADSQESGLLSPGQNDQALYVSRSGSSRESVSKNTNNLGLLLSRYRFKFAGYIADKDQYITLYQMTDIDTEATALVTSIELKTLGITATGLQCFGTLKSGDIQHLVTCATLPPQPVAQAIPTEGQQGDTPTGSGEAPAAPASGGRDRLTVLEWEPDTTYHDRIPTPKSEM